MTVRQTTDFIPSSNQPRMMPQLANNSLAFCRLVCLVCFASPAHAEVYLGQGVMSGEPTASSVLLQTRLTKTRDLDEDQDIPGVSGEVRFEWSQNEDFSEAKQTKWRTASNENDFIVRCELTGLASGTRYFYRVEYGTDRKSTKYSQRASFSTLPGKISNKPVHFVMTSCMNYNKFMYGKQGSASGPITATEQDKRLGYPAFVAINRLQPNFLIGSGDIVYYDNKINQAESLPELRQCWHEQMRFPRMVECFASVPTYWSKDDHDFRFNDSDNASGRKPLPATGIEVFREQLPIVPQGDNESPTYRTHRVNLYLQLWFTEGRDYRSKNKSPDGPEKTLWGVDQKKWLKRTLLESDAKWKIIVSPTPMVGPDDAHKRDNHANLGGFRHEADAFFDWLHEHQLQDTIVFCGDRHWQYFSIHPKGIREFACGALNDENSRMGVLPGSPKGTDPESRVRQPYTYEKPTGGFLNVKAGSKLEIEHRDDQGIILHLETLK